ncbi:MAG: non-reducing end alpha-L-arabinofuranosidase family hydrolase [Planctomycetota bacterium]|nr:non-reducing end alpha-L-arabinofuranosidase family hydrolase [Planctomycetota bacterium]MDA1141993.1 non-reducing end alpha-L-arabinofuranosidase family hydrolase [Planctomycetota bacterium]
MHTPLYTFALLWFFSTIAVLHTEEASLNGANDPVKALLAGEFQWQISQPLFAPAESDADRYYSVKDPSIVYHGGRWHLFCSVRGQKRSHQIEHLSFTDWDQADKAERRMLTNHPGFFCAPQVFYFTPHKKWYLICQASDDSWEPKYGAAYATTPDISDPDSWSKLRSMDHRSANEKRGLDFWVICDEKNAHLFFTTLDGRMWREETTLDKFPTGWSEPVLAIRGDIFEASHTYRLKGLNKYLTFIEAQGGHGWRYFKAYLSDRLEGPWSPIADTRDKTFANMKNTRPEGDRWTDCISHGELLRDGYDQNLSVDPQNLRLIFQGVLDRDRGGKNYGEIPWRLGLLTPVQ